MVVRLALKSEGVTRSAVFTSGADSECIPLANKEVVLAFLLLALLPLALPSWVGQLRLSSGVSFTRAFFLHGYSAHGGSLETLPEVGLPGKRC